MAQGLGPDEDGVVPLFNGRDLSGWHALNHWLVEDGVLHCTGERDGSGWLRSELMYEDFVLRLEYKISPRGNSGIFVRAPVVGRCSQIGMEIQIRDDRGRDPSSSSAGALYKIMAPARSVSKPAMEWNDIEISCRGKRVVTTMNGEQLYHVDLDDDELNARLADDFKASGRRRFGHIGLQNHGKPVWFRNIRIKPLPPQGYIPLFNGRDLGGWREVGHGSWSVENGLLVFEGKAAGRLLSEQMHGDFRLKLDYRLTEGAGGGVCVGGSDTDGGVEVQLLDDAGAEPSPTSSGALHGILAPAKNATRPTGGWNQLEVTRRDGVLSANLNIVDLWSAGLAEHDKLRALPARCAIGLQGSGGRIEFRNIYLKPLAPGVW
jgi:hypothetical protein